jgi:hypothetical protein
VVLDSGDRLTTAQRALLAPCEPGSGETITITITREELGAILRSTPGPHHFATRLPGGRYR